MSRGGGTVPDSSPRGVQESALLAVAAQGAHLGLWYWDCACDRLTLNAVLQDFFGDMAGESFCMAGLLLRIHPDDRARFEHILEAHLEGRRPLLECECRLLRAGGDWVWMRVRGQVVERAGDGRGPAQAVAGTFLDVSDKFQETSALSQVAEFLQSIMEHMPIGIAAHTRVSGVLIFMNARFRATLGIDSARITTVKGLFAHVFPDPEVRESWRKAVQAGVESGQAERLRWSDVPIAPAGGVPRIVTVHSMVASDRDVVITTVWDETERKQAEQALRQSQSYMATATALTHVGYFAYDRASGAITWTAETYRIFGYEPGAVAPTFDLHQSHVAPHERERVARAAHAAIERRERLDMEYTIKRCDGREAVCRVVADAVLDAMGRPTGLRGAVQDVSLTRDAEESRRRLENRLQQARRNESLGLLAGGIAHDFNNLLVAILGHADLAEDDLPRDSPVRENLLEITQAARRAADLTRQMLAYTGKSHGSKSRISLVSLLEEMLPTLEVRAGAKAALRFDPPSARPVVRVDVAQIRQVVHQLVSNASESMEDGRGEIRLAAGTQMYDADALRMPYAGDECLPGRYAFVEVRDNGCGMDAQTIERVFDPFFSTKFTGRGLGLAAVLGIVRGHGGALEVDSAPGRGSTFRMLLPALEDDASKEHPPHDDNETAGALTRTSPACILFMSEDASMCGLGRRTLERAGFAVECAPCVEHAQHLFGKSGVTCQAIVADAAVIDAAAPDALDRLRQHSACSVLILCGEPAQSLGQGWRHVTPLETPLDSGMLLRAVEGVLAEAPR